MTYFEESYLATPSDAHAEWHRNAGVPMGQPGCPQDACHPDDDKICCLSGDADFSDSRDRWECTYCGEPVADPPGWDAEARDWEYSDDDGLTDAQADAMTLSSAYGGDWWDM